MGRAAFLAGGLKRWEQMSDTLKKNADGSYSGTYNESNLPRMERRGTGPQWPH
jgi:hypothetical protein